MSKKLLSVIFVLLTFVFSKGQAQSREDSLVGFSMKEMNHHLENFKGTQQERNQRIAISQRAFIDRKYKLGVYNIPELVRKVNANLKGERNVEATNCDNIGFEDGNTTNWTMGGNTNAYGGGTATSGDYLVTSGAGLDPFGNFPVVYSGAHSLRLSDNNTGTSNFLSTATRVIAVAPTGNTFFTLDFAIDILDFPHTLGDEAKFTVAFYDASGTELACPQFQCYYYVNGATGIAVGVSNFQQTAGSPGVNLGGQTYPVTYAPWQSVAMDLTAYAGTNVTCVISCSWCIYNYDWAYCYIDADCPSTNANNTSSCGALPIELNGPTGFTSYSWTAPAGNNPATGTTDSIKANVAGTYTLSCSLNTCSTPTPYSFTYVVGTGPLASFTDVAAPACSGNFSFTNASSANGGSPITGYTWEWGDGTPNTTTTNATHTFTTAGTNTVTLVVTNGSCTDSIQKTIVVSTAIIPVVTATAALCNGNNGSITTAGTSGGSPGYSYLWSNTSTASSISATAGTYTVTITDANNCNITATAVITEPTQLRDSVTNIISEPCFGQNSGSITVGVKGGTPNYTYSWAAGGQTANPATNLTAGPYTVTVTDANGCTNTANGTITQPPALIVTANSFSVTCNGACNGQLVSIASGGTGPNYNYAWNNGATTAGVTNICPGTYSLQVTDANGCVKDTTGLVIIQPTAITATTTNTSAHCSQADGEACVTAANGTPGYTYLWSNSTTATCITNVIPGNYSVIITDANKCNDTAKVTVSNLPGDTAAITATTNVTCNGGNNGSATAGGKGNNPPYTYSWAPGAQTTQTATGLTAGNYTVIVTDAVGCSSTAVAVITQPALVVITVGTPPVICIGQSATLTASGSGGTPGYSYAWSTGSTNPSITVSPIITTEYTVNVVDANNCPAAPDSVKVIVHPPLGITVTPNNALCPGASVELNATAKGGDGTYTYTWIPTTGLNPTTGDSVNCTPSATTEYTVIANDGCGTPSVKDSVLVTVNPLPNINFTTDTLNGCTLLCIKFTNNTTVTGGGALSYAWAYGDGGSYLGTDTTYCYQNAGIYTVSLIATSDSGCIDSLIKPNYITAYSHPVAAYTYNPNPAYILNPTINFVDESTDAYGIKNWFWEFKDPADGTSIKQDPSYTYADTGTYCPMLYVTNIHNCVDSVQHCLIISPYFTFYIPNAFTPNGSGLNGVFNPQGTFICTFKMFIYDRWGQQLFYTADMNQGWNGVVQGSNTMAQEDTYIYLIEVTDCVQHKLHQYLGRVTLIK